MCCQITTDKNEDGFIIMLLVISHVVSDFFDEGLRVFNLSDTVFSFYYVEVIIIRCLSNHFGFLYISIIIMIKASVTIMYKVLVKSL